jgi:hypothetical protein
LRMPSTSRLNITNTSIPIPRFFFTKLPGYLVLDTKIWPPIGLTGYETIFVNPNFCLCGYMLGTSTSWYQPKWFWY